MLKELVAEIKKVEAASGSLSTPASAFEGFPAAWKPSQQGESASIYMGGASMQAEQAPSIACASGFHVS